MTEIEINGEVYIKKSELNKNAFKTFDKENLKYVLIRTQSAGVHVGYLKEQSGPTNMHVVLLEARRIWYWSGAATLSQLAMDGVSDPDNCKFPCVVNRIELDAIEIIDVTEKAKKSIDGVKIWGK